MNNDKFIRDSDFAWELFWQTSKEVFEIRKAFPELSAGIWTVLQDKLVNAYENWESAEFLVTNFS